MKSKPTIRNGTKTKDRLLKYILISSAINLVHKNRKVINARHETNG